MCNVFELNKNYNKNRKLNEKFRTSKQCKTMASLNSILLTTSSNAVIIIKCFV